MPADPTRLAVAPSLLDDTGGRLVASTVATSVRLAAHAAGPRPAPVLGDLPCAAAYTTAERQLAGLITGAVAQARALAGGLTAAAALYRVLDSGGADVAAESLRELGRVVPATPVRPRRSAA
jgi:hypothetical protein